MTVQKKPAKNGPTYAFLTSHIVKNAARYALKKVPCPLAWLQLLSGKLLLTFCKSGTVSFELRKHVKKQWLKDILKLSKEVVYH